MKTIPLFLFLSLIISSYSFAQNQWHISPRLGLNMVPIQENDVSGSTHKLGPSIGLMTGTDINDHWSLEFGISFNKRMAHYQYEFETDALNILSALLPDQIDSILGAFGDDALKSYEIINGYTEYWTVDIPITIAYQFESGFHFFVGPYVNYTFSVKNYESQTTHIPLLEVIDVDQLELGQQLDLLPKNGTNQTFNTTKDNINEVDYGIIGGVGYTVEKWILKFAYQYGFNDIRTDNKYVGINNQRALNLSIGYLFHPNTETSKMKPRYDLDLIK